MTSYDLCLTWRLYLPCDVGLDWKCHLDSHTTWRWYLVTSVSPEDIFWPLIPLNSVSPEDDILWPPSRLKVMHFDLRFTWIWYLPRPLLPVHLAHSRSTPLHHILNKQCKYRQYSICMKFDITHSTTLSCPVLGTVRNGVNVTLPKNTILYQVKKKVVLGLYCEARMSSFEAQHGVHQTKYVGNIFRHMAQSAGITVLGMLHVVSVLVLNGLPR